MKFLFLKYLIVMSCAAAVTGVEDKMPAWLDMKPPVITVLPREKVHNRIFQVSLESSEHAKIRYSLNTPDSLELYTVPLSIVEDGVTVVYFYGEDDVGNRSAPESIVYTLDTRPPAVQVRPASGRFGTAVTLHLSSDEQCSFFFHRDSLDRKPRAIPDSIVVIDSLSGFVSARDRAGNTATSQRLTYTVDTTTLSVVIHPPEGIYNRHPDVSFTATRGADVFYSFDPAAAPKRFLRFTGPVRLPGGLLLIRYFAQDTQGRESEISQARFVIDTIAPKIRAQVKTGAVSDTLILSTREPTAIFCADRSGVPIGDARPYRQPLVFPRKGKASVWAVARDSAGNMSEWFGWSYKYDEIPPSIKLSHSSGTYTRPFDLSVTASEPATIFYTLDGKQPDRMSPVYSGPISVSKSGVTVVKCFAVDEAENEGGIGSVVVRMDFTPPVVRARVDGSVADNDFKVTLTAGGGGRIHFEAGGRQPTLMSQVYAGPVPMKTGDVLRYFAVDSVGNQSEIYVLDELSKPMVQVSPAGGVFTIPVGLQFQTSMPASVYYRESTDSAFVLFRDSLVLGTEGLHTIEYYSESSTGLRSPMKRAEYLVDWTPPQVGVTLRKGTNDSVIVFLEANENITIYYTLDGSNPAYGANTGIAANKFFLSRDRLVLLRRADSKLTFFAEDLAGNQGSLAVLDLYKPVAVPGVPSGPGIVYDRMLSVAFNAYDERSQIFYERHAKPPTMLSPVYGEPITLLASDTIVAFVMDASGFRGDPDTFIFLLDLPPSPQFSWTPDTAGARHSISFDASKTLDQESPLQRLTFAWDFNGDGKTDYRQDGSPSAAHTFAYPGRYRVELEVTDVRGNKASIIRELLVRGYCPAEMASVVGDSGRSFCIDRYEWPNRSGAQPVTGVSWVRAKMYCRDEGKRLCTADEWRYACAGSRGTVYPYGNEYSAGQCPTEGQEVAVSGQFSSCGEGFGLSDMIGNAWEWVNDKQGMNASMAGGSFKSGSTASCGLRNEGAIVEKSDDVGFRCCR